MKPGMSSQATSDLELYDRMRAGDESAFVELYRRLEGRIFRFAWQMSGSESLAEDVTQEVFLTLLRGAESFDRARGTVAAYLFGVARKQVLRHLERDRAGVTIQSDEDGPEVAVSPEDIHADLTRRQSLEAVRGAVLALPRRYREVVVLCDLEEMDYRDAAEVLGCAVGTVRSRLHRGRNLLLDKLNRGNADPAAGGLQPARCWL